MQEGAGRHADLATELGEWWEDLWRAHTGSRVVLVQVPAGWGRSTILDRFAKAITRREDTPVTFTARVNGQDLRDETLGIQAEKLRVCLTAAMRPPPVAEEEEEDSHPFHAEEPGRALRAVELLGLDEPGGQAQLVLGIGGLFAGPTAGVSFLLVALAAGAAQKAWYASPAGQDGALARSARAIAAVSVSAPVVVIIDDADCLYKGLAVTLVENLTARQDSQVLIVATVDPGSALVTALTQMRYGLAEGLVNTAEADPDMGYQSRLELARRLRPNLPDAAARRIAQRTTTFTEVFTVATARALAETGPGEDEDRLLAVVDAAAGAPLALPAPSREAAVIAWAGGLVHARQADRALDILRATRNEHDPDVRHWESLERLASPPTRRLEEQVTADLGPGTRRAMAAAFLDEALTLAQDPQPSLIDKVAALRAAHQVRHDLPAAGQLPQAQCELVAALEALGDHAAALKVADEALAEWPSGDEHPGERDMLQATVIRLTHATSRASPGALAEQLIREAIAGGAAAGLEARIWAANVLLDTPGQREAAVALARQLTAELEARSGLGAVGDRWRLLLAYHVGRAGLPDLTTRLLAPLVTSADPARQDAASMVRRATRGPGADTRLQNILLEAELDALAPGADDDRLRIHHTLAANYHILGDNRQALAHGQHELDLHTRIHGPRHPYTLVTRANIASWTGLSGDHAAALRLYRDLLPDMEQVLGPRHHDTLATRCGIADWTGQCGDRTGALDLFRELLPDMEQVLGRRHPDTLVTRSKIAQWTGESGDPAAALRLDRELLPDMEQVLGPRHPDTLVTRAEIASLTGQCGNPAAALRLYQELLPDREEVLGPRHPDTLVTRAEIASLTGQCGNPAAALRLYQELLPDREEVLGPRHPDTLVTRAEIASLTGQCGNPAAALRLYQELLPDMEQVLGPRHPDTLATRVSIAAPTGQCGNPAAALRLFRELLPDMEQVLGHRHPDTLVARASIAGWTAGIGDRAAALRLFRELLPDMEQVLGPRHPHTLAIRVGIDHLASEGRR